MPSIRASALAETTVAPPPTSPLIVALSSALTKLAEKAKEKQKHENDMSCYINNMIHLGTMEKQEKYDYQSMSLSLIKYYKRHLTHMSTLTFYKTNFKYMIKVLLNALTFLSQVIPPGKAWDLNGTQGKLHDDMLIFNSFKEIIHIECSKSRKNRIEAENQEVALMESGIIRDMWFDHSACIVVKNEKHDIIEKMIHKHISLFHPEAIFSNPLLKVLPGGTVSIMEVSVDQDKIIPLYALRKDNSFDDLTFADKCVACGISHNHYLLALFYSQKIMEAINAMNNGSQKKKIMNNFIQSNVLDYNGAASRVGALCLSLIHI